MVAGNNELLFLYHPIFSVIPISFLSALNLGHCHRPCGAHSSLRQGYSGKLLLLLPSPSFCRELWLCEAASLFLLVYSLTPGVLTCGSSSAQIPHSDVLMYSLNGCCCCCCCCVLDVQLIVSRREIWGCLSLCHVSDITYV